METKLYTLERTLLVLCLLFSTLTVVLGQGDILPIYSTPNEVTNVMWSNDGTRFVFQEAIPTSDNADSPQLGVRTKNATWKEFLPANMQIAEADIWPLEVTISSVLLNDIRLASGNGLTSFVFPSPNLQYTVYAAPKPDNWTLAGFPLALTNLKTAETIFAKDISVDSLALIDRNYRVDWSMDGSAFTVETSSAYGEFTYYVSGYQEDIDEIEFTRIDRDLLVPDGSLFGVRPLSISTDGKRILISGLSSYEEFYIYIWDTTDGTKSKPVAKSDQRSFLDAVFNEDESSVFYVGREGLTEYNLTSGVTTVIDASINSQWADMAWFSPDATKVALLDIEGFNDRYSIYVFNVAK